MPLSCLLRTCSRQVGARKLSTSANRGACGPLQSSGSLECCVGSQHEQLEHEHSRAGLFAGFLPRLNDSTLAPSRRGLALLADELVLFAGNNALLRQFFVFQLLNHCFGRQRFAEQGTLTKSRLSTRYFLCASCSTFCHHFCPDDGTWKSSL